MEAHAVDARAAWRWTARRSRPALGLWPWLPLPFGAAYLLLIAVKFNQIVGATYMNADYASAPVIGQLYGGSPDHRVVFLGQVGWFSTLMFELATRWLPLHRQIWEVSPYAMALASVLLISWGTWKVAGRWAGAITGILLLCVGPATLSLLFSLDDHSPTWFSLALLSALLVLLETRPRRLGVWSTGLSVLVVGAVVGANSASDLLLLVAGPAAILIAAGATWLVRPRRASANAWWWVVGTVVVTGVFDALTRLLMRHENVSAAQGFAHNILASAEALSGNFKLWWQSLMVLGDGNFFGQTLGFTTALELICGVLTLAALALVLRAAWRALTSAFPRGADQDDGSTPLQIAWLSFWISSAVLLSASFIFTSNPMGITSSRYLVGVIYAVAALLPLVAVRSVALRAAVTAGAAIFGLAGVVSLLQNQLVASAGPSSYGLYRQITELTERKHLPVGYSDYWDAAPLMWSSHFRVRVYPVNACGTSSLCPFPIHIISSWYTPRVNQPTFLISDPAKPANVDPTPNLGKPSAEYHIGAVTMYVYPYDIASRMLP